MITFMNIYVCSQRILHIVCRLPRLKSTRFDKLRENVSRIIVKAEEICKSTFVHVTYPWDCVHLCGDNYEYTVISIAFT